MAANCLEYPVSSPWTMFGFIYMVDAHGTLRRILERGAILSLQRPLKAYVSSYDARYFPLASAYCSSIMGLSTLQRNKSHSNDTWFPHDYCCIHDDPYHTKILKIVLPPLKVRVCGCVNMTMACSTETVPR